MRARKCPLLLPLAACSRDAQPAYFGRFRKHQSIRLRVDGHFGHAQPVLVPLNVLTNHHRQVPESLVYIPHQTRAADRHQFLDHFERFRELSEHIGLECILECILE